MRIIVQPQKGEYKLLFLSGRRVEAVGLVELTNTPKGERPKNYRLRKAGKRQYKAVPTKDLIGTLREGVVQLTDREADAEHHREADAEHHHEARFEAFLKDLQIPYSFVSVCRMCLLDDRFTPIETGAGYIYNREPICLDCARREIRREVGYLGRFGTKSLSYIEQLLATYRDLDRVLAAIQPEQLDMSHTLFDRLEAHPVQVTSKIEDLSLPTKFVEASGVSTLMPVQQLAVNAGLLKGRHLLVVSA
ncbi:MAG: DEAD/DEAH box helicase, partial [Methanobacteriota archaeon]